MDQAGPFFGVWLEGGCLLREELPSLSLEITVLQGLQKSMHDDTLSHEHKKTLESFIADDFDVSTLPEEDPWSAGSEPTTPTRPNKLFFNFNGDVAPGSADDKPAPRKNSYRADQLISGGKLRLSDVFADTAPDAGVILPFENEQSIIPRAQRNGCPDPPYNRRTGADIPSLFGHFVPDPTRPGNFIPQSIAMIQAATLASALETAARLAQEQLARIAAEEARTAAAEEERKMRAAERREQRYAFARAAGGGCDGIGNNANASPYRRSGRLVQSAAAMRAEEADEEEEEAVQDVVIEAPVAGRRRGRPKNVDLAPAAATHT